MTNKPLAIRLKEAKQQIISCVNAVLREQELPCFLIEPIIDEVHRQVSQSAQAEYEEAIAQQHAAMQEKEGADPKRKD